ncbi:HEPN domain-containing protein [Dactylosporangium sp. NPDC049742]|uniref:HEPN domain-containing protein n=1 Tax=Dactylosporangium sp. NPDC049742 TaxID=3154737 RepID=UPI0034460952
MPRFPVWPPDSIRGPKHQLDQLALTVRNRPRTRTIDEQVWLTRFFVIRICGYLEQVVYEVTREHIRQKSGGRVQVLALSWYERTRNPTPDNLLDLVRRFGDDLADEFAQLLADDDNRLKRELKLLVDRRNTIAHGLNEGMTETKALALKADAEIVSAWFIGKLKP